LSGVDGWLVAFAAATLLIGLILHELMHALTAYGFGDPTAKDAGRLSLNPIRHIDPFGTVLLPGILIALSAAGVGTGAVFGYAKPVPVVVGNLRRPRLHSLLVSLAGPATNLVLGLIGALAARLLIPGITFRILEFFLVWIQVNVVVALFNLLPVPPLDGSAIIAAALPERARRTWYRYASTYAFPLLLLLMFAFPRVVFSVLDPVVSAVLRMVFA
jgi:Zn-dependent protease